MASAVRGRAAWEQQEREREAQELGKQLDELLDVAAVRVISVKGDPAEGPRLRAAEAQDSLRALRQLRRHVDALQAEEEGATPEEHGAGQARPARALLRRLDEAYARLHAELQETQAAAATAHSTSSRQQQLLSQRAQLLGQASEADGSQFLRRRQLRTEQDRAAAAQDVTQSLRRTQQVMAQEVQRGLGTMEVLDDSSATLQRSSGLYSQQKGKLGTAHSRLTQLQRMDRLDRLIIALGTLFFLCVCAYILYRRVPLLRYALSAVLSPLAALLGVSAPARQPPQLPQGFPPGSFDPEAAAFQGEDTCPNGVCIRSS